MRSQNTSNVDQLIENRHVTLLELLDRIVDKGVMLQGEILLSVADVDLIYLNLELLLSSVKTVVHAARTTAYQQSTFPDQPVFYQQEVVTGQDVDEVSKEIVSLSSPQEHSAAWCDDEKAMERVCPPSLNIRHRRRVGKKTNVDQKNVEKGLVKLVLTLVDLIRQLMEKQAIRRIDDEQLSEAEIEKVGNAFFLLDEKMMELKKTFDLTDEDLNLDLGPLGNLL